MRIVAIGTLEAGYLFRNEADAGSTPVDGSMHVVAAGAAVGFSPRLPRFDSRHVCALEAALVKAPG